MPSDNGVQRILQEDWLSLSLGEIESRQIPISGMTILLKLHRASWEALDEICRRERTSPVNIIAALQERSVPRRAFVLQRAVEVFIAAYYRQAANQEPSAIPIANLIQDGRRPN